MRVYVCWNTTRVSLWLLYNVHFVRSTLRTCLQTEPFVHGINNLLNLLKSPNITPCDYFLGICQKTGIRPSISTRTCWPKGTDHCSSEEYQCTHGDACVAIILISYRCVPCNPWCTHRTYLVVKKLFYFSCGYIQFH
jgi:hypothetical protein